MQTDTSPKNIEKTEKNHKVNLTKTATQQKQREMSPPKTCAVCGDKALGYNFNAVTCESCKAFFRRNALAKKQFTCPFNQNCEMTVVTRRFCQKCRLKKCLDIGMKSENIMSEEDKLIKRRKIENNRAKRGVNDKKHKAHDDKGGSSDSSEIKHESVAADSSGAFDVSHDDSQSSFDSAIGGTASNGAGAGTSRQAISSTAVLDPLQDVNPDLMTSEEIVDFLVGDPDRATQAINKVMRTPAEAVCTVEKIINSQKDALRLISHLIAFPGDALKIISKIMNSPFDALTVFTKFMSSPTDGLEIISKVVSSPQDVLQFIRNLMDSPEDGIDIMNKFMNTPAEALKILNKIFNGPSHAPSEESATNLIVMENQPPSAESPTSQASVREGTPELMENTLIHTILNQSPLATQSVLVSPPPPPPSVSVSSPASPYATTLATTPGTMVASPAAATSSFTSSSPAPSSPFTSSTTVTMGPPSPFTASPQPMSLTSPVSVTPSDMQYNSPSSMHSVELPSTSMSGLMTSSPTNVSNSATETDFSSDQFDIRAFMQNSYLDNNATSSFDSINSLESVLSEVIRIEYQAFNNLLTEPRIKQEQQHGIHSMSSSSHYNGGSGGYHNSTSCNPQPQLIYPTSTSMIAGRELNEAEQMKLRELKLASEALYYPVDDDLSVLMMGDERMKPDETHQDPKLLQIINLTAVAIKRLIKMAKKITAFRDMCQEDQVALLKGGCTEMMIMRGIMTYNDNRNTWKIPHTKEDMSNIRAEVLKLAKGNVYEEHLKFVRTFDEKWRMDENIILIMCAIVLFTPTRQRIIHSDVIRLEQNSYYYLLRRYLESVYPGCEAKSAFIKLIQKVSDVERLNQVIIGVYLNVNPSQVEPLLREIFDIKNY